MVLPQGREETVPEKTPTSLTQKSRMNRFKKLSFFFFFKVKVCATARTTHESIEEPAELNGYGALKKFRVSTSERTQCASPTRACFSCINFF